MGEMQTAMTGRTSRVMEKMAIELHKKSSTEGVHGMVK